MFLMTVSRLKAVRLYHDLNSRDHQQEFSSPFEPLPPVEQMTHMAIQLMKFSLHLI